MIIKCDNCDAGFNFDITFLKEKGTKVRCSKCNHKFKVFPAVMTDNYCIITPGGYVKPRMIIPDFDVLGDFQLTCMVTAQDRCPYYEIEDEFEISNKKIGVPYGKPLCLNLFKAMTKMVVKNGNFERIVKKEGLLEAECSDCEGFLRISLVNKIDPDNDNLRKDHESCVGIARDILAGFEIFKAIESYNTEIFLDSLKTEKYEKGQTIIQKGESGRRLHIIVSGKVEVVGEDEMVIASMEKGDVFGETSLLTGDPVVATIRVAENATILYITASNFKKLLSKSHSLQMYFTRLLARRMGEINLARSEEFALGMTGRLSDIPPSELFQTMNLNQKTGMLVLETGKGPAHLLFKEGELIQAQYRKFTGEEAFYALLKLKTGRFKFHQGLSSKEMELNEIGDFMHLLMEGLRRIDEADKNFLKTLIPEVNVEDTVENS